MTQDSAPTAVHELASPPSRRRLRDRPAIRFGWHLIEMGLAMLVGMVLLQEPWDAAGASLGVADTFAQTDVSALVKAVNMVAGVAAWMCYRRHRWPAIAEMSAAMVLPYLVLLVPYWLGFLPADVVHHGGHLLMLLAMLLAMLRRRGEYTHRHTCRTPLLDPATPATGLGRLQAWLVRRWPTWLVLLLTIDYWFAPSAPPPWILLLLPLGYLVIGGLRRQLGQPGQLALQLAGLAGYLVLVLVAYTVNEDLARCLVGAGWLAHAGWDLIYHRINRVVPRFYAEGCTVFDTVIGVTIIFLM